MKVEHSLCKYLKRMILNTFEADMGAYLNRKYYALLPLAVLCFAVFAGKTPGQDLRPLAANERVERQIKPEESHLYSLTLKRGDLVHITVEQHGINIVAAVAKAADSVDVLKQAARENGTDGTEELVFMAESDGQYFVGVFGFEPSVKDASYILQNSAPFTTNEQKARAAAELLTDGAVPDGREDYQTALLYHQHAVTLLNGLPDSAQKGEARFRLGNDLFGLQNYTAAIEQYRKAIPIFLKVKDDTYLGLCHFNIGGAFRNLKDYANSNLSYIEALPLLIKTGSMANNAEANLNVGENYRFAKAFDKALEYFERALPAYRALKDRSGEAIVLFDLALTSADIEDFPKAEDHYLRALEIFRELKDKRNEANTLSNLSFVSAKLQKSSVALDYLKQTLAILPELNDPAFEATLHVMLGNTYLEASQNNEALAQFQIGLKQSRETHDRRLEIAALRGIGLVNSEFGNYETALKFHEDALKIAEEIKDESEIGVQLSNFGLVYMEMGKYDRSFTYNLRALEISRKLKDRYSERTVLNNLGVAYLRLGSLNKALDYIKRSAAITRELNDTMLLGPTIANIGTVYSSLKQYDNAIANFEEALPLLTREKNNRFLVTTNYYYGTVRRELGQLDKAVILHNEAIRIARFAHTPKFEARALIELGLDRVAQNSFTEAAKNFLDALLIAREVKAPEEESAALDGLMQAYDKLGNRGLAIFYGKQSVNLVQMIRGEIKRFDKDIQSNYIKDNERTYRQLADILIAEGRLPEAQQVLGMLKEEELSDFVRRDAKEIEQLSKRADLRTNEKAALEKYNSMSGQITALGLELGKLEEKKRKLAAGEVFPEQARYDQLTEQIKDANTAFRVFLQKELAAELGANKKREIDADRALQGKLRQWGEGTVAISTMLGEDRYRVILTTPNVQIDAKSEIKAAELNKKIFAFREALLRPELDPRPLGKELYDILIKPIENDLAASGAKTLLWSLDGTLRYIPIAALWDGQKYMVEKYQNVIVTSTTRQSLVTNVTNDWRILGAGVTKASEVTDESTSQKYSFQELKGVANELNAILGTDVRAAKGVGLLDQAFTEDALKTDLSMTLGDKRKFNVIHFATHFRLGSDTGDSFLLLGNNKALTLADIADSPEMNLTDVELVTLSACNTGFGSVESKDSLTANNGKEVDSLAQFIELRGAKSVMATLWAVVDESTSLLMGEFYRLRKANPTWSKAEALRQAQISLLTGKNVGSSDPNGRRSDPIDLDDSTSDQPRFKKDNARPFAHPHYWAPFVLIGNWR